MLSSRNQVLRLKNNRQRCQWSHPHLSAYMILILIVFARRKMRFFPFRIILILLRRFNDNFALVDVRFSDFVQSCQQLTRLRLLKEIHRLKCTRFSRNESNDHYTCRIGERLSLSLWQKIKRKFYRNFSRNQTSRKRCKWLSRPHLGCVIFLFHIRHDVQSIVERMQSFSPAMIGDTHSAINTNNLNAKRCHTIDKNWGIYLSFFFHDKVWVEGKGDFEFKWRGE